MIRFVVSGCINSHLWWSSIVGILIWIDTTVLIYFLKRIEFISYFIAGIRIELWIAIVSDYAEFM